MSLLVTLGGCEKQSPATKDNPGTPPASMEQWLVDVTELSGLRFECETGAAGAFYMPENMHGGVGVLDYDNDDDLDVCLINGNELLPDVQGVSTRHTNQLFRNDGQGRFTDVTAASGLGDGGFGMGLAVGDIDNDGDADIYFTNVGPDRLYQNNGDGTFADISGPAGIDVPEWSASAAFVDIDRDGRLDLYVCQYLEFNPRAECFDAVGRRAYCSPKAFSPRPDVLLRNVSDESGVRFEDISESAGLHDVPPAAGLGVVCEDVNDDGWIDIYVANDGYANHMWLNRGDASFEESALTLGCAYNVNGVAEAGMGLLSADLDDDLDPDLFITHLVSESNTIYRNLGGNRGYDDGTGASRTAAVSMPFTGFGTAAVDLDLSGDLDLLVANGRVRRGTPHERAQLGPHWNEYAEPNLVHLNQGGGVFSPGDAAFAAFTDPVNISRGLASGDLDGDGDLDFVLNDLAAPARVYENRAPRQGGWLSIRAIDPALNRDAYGARLIVVAGDRRWLRTISTAQGYCTSVAPLAHVGLGDIPAVDAIEVRWPDGLEERFPVEGIDRTVVLRRGEGKAGEPGGAGGTGS